MEKKMMKEYLSNAFITPEQGMPQEIISKHIKNQKKIILCIPGFNGRTYKEWVLWVMKDHELTKSNKTRRYIY